MDSGISYREARAPGRLARYLECAWTVEARKTLLHPVTPDGCIDLVFSREAGLRVVGAMTRRRDFGTEAGSWDAGLRFRPGMAAAFLGLAVDELTDQLVPARDIWPARGRELEARLEAARDPGTWPGLLGAAFAAPAREATGFHQALEAIAGVHGQVHLGELARAANLSERQFRRRCLQESGLTPKQLCRILRFRFLRERALEKAMRGWAELALEAGYCDQAHMIHDFREFMGEAPTSVFSKTQAGAAG